MSEALIIVDVQNDFALPSGSLSVPGGEEVVPVINAMRSKFDCVVLTKDWHPEGHISFQGTWPVHCVQGSSGAELHAALKTEPTDKIVLKGVSPTVDSYSGFYDNNHTSMTELHEFLQSKKIDSVTVVGLAYDYCVGYTALDAKQLGYSTTVMESATRGVAPASTTAMKEKLVSNGIRVVEIE